MDYDLFDREAYIANHLRNVEEKYSVLQQIYGADFNTFFFRPDIDTAIRKGLLGVRGGRFLRKSPRRQTRNISPGSSLIFRKRIRRVTTGS